MNEWEKSETLTQKFLSSQGIFSFWLYAQSSTSLKLTDKYQDITGVICKQHEASEIKIFFYLIEIFT